VRDTLHPARSLAAGGMHPPCPLPSQPSSPPLRLRLISLESGRSLRSKLRTGFRARGGFGLGVGEEGGGTELSNARLTGCCNIKPPSNPTRMGGSGTSHAPGSFECETWETKRCNESWEWWRKLGSPRYTCAPMVNNSELAFRRLVRKYGCELTYSPMISARKFLALPSDEARLALVEPDPADRPFIVQFAGDDPEHVLEAGRIIERLGVADAIDINLGCPQPQAVRDHYGSILMEEPELVERIVATAAHGLGLPVTVKMRVLKTGRGQSSLRHSVTVTSVSFSRHVPTANLSGRYCSLCVL